MKYEFYDQPTNMPNNKVIVMTAVAPVAAAVAEAVTLSVKDDYPFLAGPEVNLAVESTIIALLTFAAGWLFRDGRVTDE